MFFPIAALLLVLTAVAAQENQQLQDIQLSHGAAESSYRSKRQDDTCDTEQIRYLFCDPSYVRAVEDISKGNNCLLQNVHLVGGFDYDFRYILDCGRNKRGTLCAKYAFEDESENSGYEYDKLMKNIINECLFVDVSHGSEFSENEPPTTACASVCRYALQQFAETFDCCIHSSREKIVLIPQLWSICGVQQPQPCEDTPNVVFPEPEDMYTCSLKCAQTQFYALDCRYRASKKAEFYTRCPDEGDVESYGDIVEYALRRCHINHNGDFCILTYLDTNTRLDAYNKCYRLLYGDNDTCSEDCRSALQGIKDRLGCCFNHKYNRSEDQHSYSYRINPVDELSRYELWSTCGVETPGKCKIPSDLSQYDDMIRCNSSDDSQSSGGPVAKLPMGMLLLILAFACLMYTIIV